MTDPDSRQPPPDTIVWPDRRLFEAIVSEGVFCPVTIEIKDGARLLPIEIFEKIRDGGPAFLLESGKGARFSFAGRASGPHFSSHGTEFTRLDGTIGTGNPFDALRRELPPRPVWRHPLLPAFRGGVVGFLAYDMARHIERLPARALENPLLPDSLLMPVDAFYQIDHELGRLHAVVVSSQDRVQDYDVVLRRLEDMKNRVLSRRRDHRQVAARSQNGDGAASDLHEDSSVARRADSGRNSSGSRASLDRGGFEQIVERALDYIAAGDIFQVNLSVRFEEEYAGDPLELYRRLRAINPAPYMSYFDLPEMAVASASPELLMSVRDRRIETRPIAGTRSRGSSEEEDREKIAELLGNEKERAEHLMLVDLERNDIGRVASYGTVRVDEFMAVELYSHVIHIVSHVSGELAVNRDVFDAITACFPGGTITGAPKVRSMEIIEELEPVRRGLYTGSIGWIGYDHDAELNIAIRTIVVHDSVAYAQAGAGIVYDSVPRHEYRESLRKAEAALQALRESAAARAIDERERS